MNSRRSGIDWLLEGLSLAALLAATADVAMHWTSLPERIPIHFDAAGNPNGSGNKQSLLLLLGSTFVMAIVLTVAERYQRLINIPIKVDRDSPEVRQLLRSMVIAIKAAITISFAWIADMTMKTAAGEANGLGRAFLLVFLGGVIAPSVYYLIKVYRV